MGLIGSLVSYRTVAAGTIKGKVIDVNRWYYTSSPSVAVLLVKVTSHNNPVYPKGYYKEIRADDPWLTFRRRGRG